MAFSLVLLAGLACKPSSEDPTLSETSQPALSSSQSFSPSAPAKKPGGGYLGSSTCASCHPTEYEDWRGSHHDLAMQVASAQSVLANFDNTLFESGATQLRFVNDGEQFFVETPADSVHPEHLLEEPTSEEATSPNWMRFPVTHAFGVEPLQQYLVAFGGGKLQCLTVAWDTERERWFDLYPDDDFDPSDSLHWTGRSFRWNAMCAECHSTNLVKNYDLASDSYSTTWSEINVACEACHGPGQGHLDWLLAHSPEVSDDSQAGVSASVAPATDPARGFAIDLKLDTAGQTSGQPIDKQNNDKQNSQVNACARCHSRRSSINSFAPGNSYHDDFALELLRQGLYYPDGQIQDEVYVFGSFAQSKMFHAGVTCTDCHNPHSLELLHAQDEGDGTCLQCHNLDPPTDRFPNLQANDYTDFEHHHHSKHASGARCVNCHMPERNYMVVDPRRDHSFRVPRPDLSIKFGTPNACNNCHKDQDPEWAQDQIESWQPLGDPVRDSAGKLAADSLTRAFALGRIGDPKASEALLELLNDPQSAAIAKATALELLASQSALPPETLALLHGFLTAESPLLRASAARVASSSAQRLGDASLLPALLARLADSNRQVRIETARVLAGLPMQGLDEQARQDLERANAEFLAAQALSADLPAAHLNLGLFHERRGETTQALEDYEHALAQDPAFLPACFNLTNLYNRLGNNERAHTVLTQTLELSTSSPPKQIWAAPERGELHYSLGLLSAEMGRADQALEHLLQASQDLPHRARVHYNCALALQAVGQLPEAEAALAKAERADASDPDVARAQALLYLQLDAIDAARTAAERAQALDPNAPMTAEVLRRVEAFGSAASKQ